jgi:myo-inositol-1(or 4)-monophosphatase
VSGDVTFQLDRVAEKALLIFLKRAGQPVAYYSEDSGYTTFTSDKPKHLLVVDPIDGSRSAKSGFEGCVVSVASTRVIERPSMADVDNACVLEILGDRLFTAERGRGARVTALGQARKIKLSANANLDMLTWSMTVPARPAELIFPTAARLIDISSLKGGFFACNSTAFSLTRLLTDQLDACVDVANRYFRDIPNRVREMFQRAGCGRVIGVAPYDLAASLLIAEEAGCIVTDAYGKSFNNVLLLDSSETNHLSVVAAANRELHEKLMEFLNRRISLIEERLSRTA